jgi:DNA-binding transcriptional LysR family regulator
VTVAYGASASYETAPRLLRALTERHPGITMTTAVKSVSEIITGLTDGSVDMGLVRCPPKTAGLDAQRVRMQRQGVLLRRDHRLASSSALAVHELADETVLPHPREGNPGHYDAVLGMFLREHALEPRVELRTLSFDLACTPILQGGVITIIGESSTSIGLPDELCWVPLSPPVKLEVALLTRRHQRSTAVERLLEAAAIVSADLRWI